MTHQDACRWVQRRLSELAVAEDAAAMQAYMKDKQPYYGVKRPLRRQIEKELYARFPPADADAWQSTILALWDLPHREERYIAIEYALRFKTFHTPDALDLGFRLVQEGAWWDLVDAVAINFVGAIHRRHREAVQPRIASQIDSEDMWLRRTAILSQLKHRTETDEALLFRLCLERAHETEFFIRKAIGWALREYGKTAPERVKAYVTEHREAWSGLTWREATRRLP